MLAGTPLAGPGCPCKRQPLHASQLSLRCGCLRYVLCALPLINRGGWLDCPALRYAAESVWHGSLFAPTPHGFGSLLMFEYIGVCAALQPQFDIISKPTPFACRKGVSPLTAIDTLIRCTTFARSKWLAVPAISPSNRPAVGCRR